MEYLIIGYVLVIIGFVIFRMARQPIEKQPSIIDALNPFTPLIYSGLIISGLYLSFQVQWYIPIIVFFTAPILSEIIRKLIWH